MSGEPGITRSRFVIALVIVVWTFFGTDTPRGAEVCDFNNSVSQNPTVVTIDAVTGLITDRTYVRRGKPVRIQLINKNPFKYVYSTSIDVQTLDESKTITTFLELLSLPGFVSGLWSDVAPEPAKPSVTADSRSPNCKDTEAELLGSLESEFRRLSADANSLSVSVVAAQKVYEPAQAAHDRFIAATEPDRIDCTGIVGAAGDTQQKMDAFLLGELPSKVPKHALEAAALAQVVSLVKPQQEGCKQRHAILVSSATTLQAHSKLMASDMEKMVAGKQRMDALSKVIVASLHAGAFKEQFDVGARRRPSRIHVKLTRTSRRDEKAAAVTHEVTIQAGEPLFALSFGAGRSTIAERDYAQVDSLVPDGMGGTVAGKRFEKTDESEHPTLGAVLLSANLWRGERFDAVGALSVGVSVGQSDDAAAIGYLFGVSGGFLDQTFYVTAAYHMRDVDRLGGRFSEGDVVPAGISGVPVRKEAEEGFMIIFSYNVLRAKGD